MNEPRRTPAIGLTTSAGDELVLTDEHLVWTTRGYVEARSPRVGDVVRSSAGNTTIVALDGVRD